MIDSFLLGVVVTTWFIAGVFFLKFWRDTRDSLFLSFSIAFLIEGVNRTGLLFSAHPNEASPWVYVVRLIAFFLILAAIVKKNYASGG
jgi:uncharacterized membrane protein HdeD (DUF308 family)